MLTASAFASEIERLADRVDDLAPADVGLWDEPIVSPTEFIESDRFYGDREGIVWPALKDDLNEIFSGEDFGPRYHTVIIREGIGSGKSTRVGLIFAYLLYRLHNYSNLRTALGLMETNIAFMNMAPRAEQARQVLFRKVNAVINRVAWFGEKGYAANPRVRSRLEFTKDDYGIIVEPGNSSENFPLGADLYGGCIDEAALGYVTQEWDYCENIYNALNDRRESRFGEDGLVLMISSAGTEDCFFETKIEEAGVVIMDGEREERPEGDPNILFVWRPQWKAKPMYSVPKQIPWSKETFPILVTRETADGDQYTVSLEAPMQYHRAWMRNPRKFQIDIAALPTVAIEPYIENWQLFIDNVNRSRPDPCPDLGNPGLRNRTPESPDELFARLPDWFMGEPGTWYVLHVDLATTRDACGLALAHRGPDVERVDEEGNAINVPTAFVDLVVRFKASPEQEIIIADVERFIRRLISEREFEMAKITFDGWQSRSTVQNLNRLIGGGVKVKKRRAGQVQAAESEEIVERVSIHSSDKESYDTMKSLWYDGRVDIFWDLVVMWEAKRLQEVKGKVDHAAGASNDEMDCVARVCTMAIEDLDVVSKQERSHDPRFGKVRRRARTGIRSRGVAGAGGARPRPTVPVVGGGGIYVQG